MRAKRSGARERARREAVWSGFVRACRKARVTGIDPTAPARWTVNIFTYTGDTSPSADTEQEST